MEIEYYWDVSCGLDSFMVNMEDLPTSEKSFDIMMKHCVESKIDPRFAIDHIVWWKWGGEKVSYRFAKPFKDSKREEIKRTIRN